MEMRDAGVPAGGKGCSGPLYLASALCMLVGYFILVEAATTALGHAVALPLLAGALEFYEALLLGLGLFLIARRRHQAREGTLLVLIALLFTADATFLNVEVGTVGHPSALLVPAVLFVLGVGKGYLVLRALGVRPRWHAAMSVVEFAILLALPGVLAAAGAAGDESGTTMLSSWWMLGGLLAVRGAVHAFTATNSPVKASDARMNPRDWILAGMTWIPLASIAVHLVLASFVFDTPVCLEYASPVLLGAAIHLALSRPPWLWYGTCRGLVASLPVVAVLAVLPSSGVSYQLAWLGAAAAYVIAFATERQVSRLVAGVFVGIAGCSGDSLRAQLDVLAGALPSTRLQWGLLTVILAFALLAWGARSSLRRAPSTG